MKLVISGSPGVGKTTLAQELHRRTGIRVPKVNGMRQQLAERYPGIPLGQISSDQYRGLSVDKMISRKRAEQGLDRFISDASLVQDWIYLQVRTYIAPFGGQIYNYNALEYRPMVFGYSAQVYSHVVHLDPEFPFPEDGHRPSSVQFRNEVDRLLISAWEELSLPVQRVHGSVDNRVGQVLALYPGLQSE